MSLYEIGNCSYCNKNNQILRPSPFMADTKAIMCEHCWNETKKEYSASNGEYIPDFDSNKGEYDSVKNSISVKFICDNATAEEACNAINGRCVDCCDFGSCERCINKDTEVCEHCRLKNEECQCCDNPYFWINDEVVDDKIHIKCGECGKEFKREYHGKCANKGCGFYLDEDGYCELCEE